MRLSAAVVLIVLISGSLFAIGAGSKRAGNKTFFNGPSNPCKGSRPRNPVELVKTHVFATKIFNEIGTKTMVRLGLKYQVPHSFVRTLCDMGCVHALFAYTALSDDGNMILPPKVRATHVIALIKRSLFAASIGLPELVFHQ